MKKQVVLFGAGASYGARQNPSPPLGKGLHKWVLEYFNKKYDELDSWEQQETDPEEKLEPEEVLEGEKVRRKVKLFLENAPSYEALANALWTGNKIDYLIKLNFLLAASMTPPFNKNNPHEEPRVNDSFVEKLDVYDEWLKSCVKKADHLKNFTFITLNYDCLLERAICRTFFTCDQEERQCRQCLCTHVRYPYIGGPETGVEVLKLHGSINWIGILDGDSKSLPIPIDVGGISTYPDIGVVPTCIKKTDDQDPSELIIATYATGKPPQANPKEFEKIKNLAKDRIREAQKIEIIGVHIPPNEQDDPTNEQDDPTLLELFQSMRGKNVNFINPSEEENNLAKVRFGFNPIRKSFKEYVDSQT